MEPIIRFTKSNPYCRYCNNVKYLIKNRGMELIDDKKIYKPEDIKNKSNIHMEGKGFEVFVILEESDELKKVQFHDMIKKLDTEKIIVIGDGVSKISHLSSDEQKYIELIEIKSLSRNFAEHFRVNGIKISIKTDLSDMKSFHASDVNSYPQINSSTMECIWVGAKVGDVLYMERPNPGTTCTTGEYRLVVN